MNTKSDFNKINKQTHTQMSDKCRVECYVKASLEAFCGAESEKVHLEKRKAWCVHYECMSQEKKLVIRMHL
jgi:hypothetical protein